MSTLLIFRGLPASGKTTEARKWVAFDPTSRARVNRDDLRAMLHDGKWLGHATEQQIVAARNACIAKLLRQGMDVCCDDTNLPQDLAKDLAKLARDNGAGFMVSDLTGVHVDECVRRDALRSRPVGETVIRGMHQKYLAGRTLAPVVLPAAVPDAVPATYVRNPSLPTAILVDIDGTVALMNGRDPYDESRVHEDKLNSAVAYFVQAMADHGHVVVFMSGRSDWCRDATLAWLAAHFPEVSAELYMRATGDSRKDYVVKRELFDAHVANRWNVVAVLDDRDSVVAMWRAMGLTCLQVAPGNF